MTTNILLWESASWNCIQATFFFRRWIVKKNDAADPCVEFYRNTSLHVRRKDNPFRTATPTFTSCSFKYRREILALAGAFPQMFHSTVDRPPIIGSVMLNVCIIMLCVRPFLCYNKTRTRRLNSANNIITLIHITS